MRPDTTFDGDDLVTPLIQLSICCAVLIALLILWRSPIHHGFQGIAMATAILGASPATLLTAIDFGRVLRRQSISARCETADASKACLAASFALPVSRSWW